MIISNRYKLSSRLNRNEQNVCQVFKGINILTKEDVVIKMEPQNAELKLLKNESMIYYYLKDVPYTLPMKWFGKFDKYLYFVLPFKEICLSDLITLKLSTEKISDIVGKVLKALENIHSKEILHRDIKPDNILLDDKMNVFLIDFGFAKKYTFRNQHIPLKVDKQSILGTPNFISLHVHNKIEPSRRDDMVSLGYIWLNLLLGFLPWENKDIVNYKTLFLTSNQQNLEICKVKTYINRNHLLTFEETPEYIL
jgi:serine/threonine protein kinase